MRRPYPGLMCQRFNLTLLFLGVAITMGWTARPSCAQHPVNPWVFRTTLDRVPNTVIIALADDMWVAYDTIACQVVMAWDGGIREQDGQFPTIQNDRLYFQYIQPSIWSVTQKKDTYTPRAVSRGYRFTGNSVAMDYELVLEDGAAIQVTEIIDYSVNETEQRELTRRWRFDGIPEKTKIEVDLMNAVPFDNINGLGKGGKVESLEKKLSGEEPWSFAQKDDGFYVVTLSWNG